jgi:hypothetical protein
MGLEIKKMGAPTPLLSTPGAPECHAVPHQGTKCGANRAHGHVRELGLEEGRGKDPGPGSKAEQRLSRHRNLLDASQLQKHVLREQNCQI